MSVELEAARLEKLDRESREERQLVDVVYRALGADLVRIRRFLETALAELQASESKSARITLVDIEELGGDPNADPK